MKESIQNTNSSSWTYIHKVKRQHMLEKKECCMEKLFLATLWTKLLIITVNFGNKTKVFSENFGW